MSGRRYVLVLDLSYLTYYRSNIPSESFVLVMDTDGKFSKYSLQVPG